MKHNEDVIMILIDKAINTYIINAIKHGEATEAGDSIGANRFHDALIESYRTLSELGREGLMSLIPLMDHKNASVRCWSATHGLELDRARAELTLCDLLNNSSAISLTAEIVLSEWRKGTLVMPK